MIQIKGKPISDTIRSSIKFFGETELQRLLSLLDPKIRRIYEEGIIESYWYPLDAYTKLLDVIVKEKHNGDGLMLAKGSAKLMEKNFKGIYAVFVKLGSAEYFIKKVASFTQSTFEGIFIEISAPEKHKILVKYKGFEKQHAVFENIIKGFYQKGLELSGATNVKTNFTTSCAAGRGYSELTITWDSKHFF